MSNQAEKELKDIINYINQVLLEPEIAKRLLNKFKDMISNLKTYPEKYILVNDEFIIHSNVRKFFVDNYVLVYRVNSDINRVEISHIFYARRDWMKLI